MKLTVSKRVWIPILVAAAGMLALVWFARVILEQQMMTDRIAKIKSISQSAVSVVQHYQKAEADGRLSQEDAQAKAIDALRDLRYDGGSGYIYIYTLDGINVMLPSKPGLEGKDLSGLKDPSGFEIIKDFIKQVKKNGSGITRYGWEKPGSDQPEPKASYNIGFKPWHWIVGTGIYVDDVQAEIADVTYTLFGVFALFLGLVIVPSAWVAHTIAKPIRNMTDSMQKLAQGQLETEIGYQTKQDEIGEMAKAVNVFKENAIERQRLEAEASAREQQAAEERRELMMRLADDFEDAIGGVLRNTSSTAHNLTNLATKMSSNAERTTEEAHTVRDASDMAARNVETVAAASEELSTSIHEIAGQIQEASTSARDTATDAEMANGRVNVLNDAAVQIGEVIGLINDIANQTNLLALNATIEAARAGEAGKGFAVVANEVKTLANQTAKATQDITDQINQIQEETRQVVTAIGAVSERIVGIDNVTASIASAIEEQTAATAEISRSVSEASEGTRTVSNSISAVVETAVEAQHASEELSEACQELQQQTTELKVAVDNILEVIRQE